MPYVPPPAIETLHKRDQAKLRKLLFERAVLKYGFSYESLAQYISEDDMQQCVAAYNDDELKTKIKELNDSITGILADNGVTSIRSDDPFGRTKDFIYIESSTSSFKKDRAIAIATSRPHKVMVGKKVVEAMIPIDTITNILKEATVSSKFTTLQARDVKGENGDGEE